MIPPSSPDKPDTRPALLAQLTSPTWRTLAALCSITLVFYHGLWLPGLVLIKRDAFRLFPQLKQYAVERLSAGELPQWFPYEALGRPFIVTTHTGVFHPFTALYFLFPVSDAYRFSTLLCCLCAALGAYALGRVLAFSRSAALAAGITFTLSGYVVSLTDHLVYLYSICLLPLFCATLEKALVGDRAWTVAPAVMWATVFLNGDVQTGYYYGFIALLWATMRARCSTLEAVARLALLVLLTVMLAGVQLGPGTALYAGSTRTQPSIFHEEALYWATHPLRLLTVLASPIGQNVDPVAMGRLFFGAPGRGLWAESLYLGIPVTGLALLGAWHRRDLRVLTLLGAFALLLALGRLGGLYEIFYHIVPFWSVFRYPEKLMGLVSFSAAMLAGAGIDVLRDGKGHPLPWLAAATLCTGAWCVLRTDQASAWMATTFQAPAPLASTVTSSASHAFLFSAVASLGVWLVITGNRRGWLRAWTVIAALIAILTLDLSRANLEAYRTGPAEAARFVPPFTEVIAAREGTPSLGRFRLITMHESRVSPPNSLRVLSGPLAQSVERRQALDLDHNAQFHLETPVFYLPGYNAALTMIFGKFNAEVAARFNVTYFIGRRFQFKDQRYAKALLAILPDYDLALVRNPVPAKPRVYLSWRPERADSHVDPVALIARPDFVCRPIFSKSF